MALGSANGATVGAATGSDGFFSLLQPVFTGIGQGLGSIASNVIPRFAAQELLDQKADQLRNPTFSQAFAPPRLNDGQLFTTDVIDNRTPATKAGLFFDSLNISGGGILLMGVALIGLILVLRK